MNVTKEELGDALVKVAEEMNRLETAIARLSAGLTVLKGLAALELNPTSLTQGLAQIHELEDAIMKIDPSAPARQRIAEVLDVLKLLEKHGPPRES